MHINFTPSKTRRCSFFISLVFSCFFTVSVLAQTYVNGNLSTGAVSSNGVTAPTGFTWSELQTGNNTAGFDANISTGLTVADNFTISCGTWNITKFTFYAYSVGYTGAASPFNDVRVRIFNTDPSTGNPTPVFGNLTTNRFLASSSASMYRILNGSAVTTRKIWKIEASVPVTLSAGNYWVEWELGNGGISNLSPSSTVVGSATQPGNNAKKHNLTSGAWTNLLDGTNAQDMPFQIDFTSAGCTGTPDPGNTVSTVTTSCSGSPFTLSLQNCIPGSGVTYQWQEASALAGPYTNVATGGISATYTTSLAATTYYRCIVTCSGNNGTSTPVQVMLSPITNCYCIPPPTNCSSNDEILNVTFGSLNNSSSGCSGSGYTNYTSLPAPTVYAGAPNPISVKVGSGGTENVYVWIDYNQNGVFDLSEFTSLGSGSGSVVQNNITIPVNALPGPTRMRVRVRFSTTLTGNNACTTYSFGETEDYTVNIAPCESIAITSSPANQAISCGNNASFTVGTTGSLPAYSWQYRTSAGGTWQAVTNGGIFSGANTATLSLSNVSQSFNGYQFRALVTGGCSVVDFSSPGTLTVNQLVPAVNPSAANICSGTVQQLSLTSTVSIPVSVTFNAAAGLPLTIPDNNLTGVLTNDLAVSGIPAGSTIKNVSIKFSLTHTFVGDILMNLKAPNGQVLNLVGLLDGANGNNSTDNFTNTVIDSLSTTPLSGAPAPRTGTFMADGYTANVPLLAPTTTESWSPLLGTINGNWALAICDVSPGIVGTLTAWSITITYVSPSPVQGVWTGPANTMFTDNAATIPYSGTPATTIYVKPAVSSNYQVSFSTSTPCTSTTTTVPVNVVLPATNVIDPGNAVVCLGDTARFTTSASGGPLSYQWQVSSDGGNIYTSINGAVSATLKVPNVTLSQNNFRYRCVISAAPCSASVTTAAAILTVKPLPVVTITSPGLHIIPGQTTSVTASSSPAAAVSGWSWTFNNRPLSVTTNSVTGIDVDHLGVYKASVTDINGCKNSSAEIVIGAEATDRLWIYPNPTSGDFHIRLYFDGSLTETRVVTLYNPLGQSISSRSITLQNNSNPYQQMDFSLGGAVAKGTYVVKVAHKVSGKVISGLIVVR